MSGKDTPVVGADGTPVDNAPQSWVPQVLVSGNWCGNALRFATEQEASDNASDLLLRWYVPTDSRAVPSNDPVNYSYDRSTGLQSIGDAS